MIVTKQSASILYTFECGASIPITIGYETYGVLNEDKSNAILVCHYFSGTSHAAGKYSEDDAAAGWWDGLIGPGKAIDTNRFFVICTDNICNVQVHNKHVITTGPASINPETGKRYGMSFPPFTFCDMAAIQRELLRRLEIPKLYAAVGPSAGGMIALHWAVSYPDMLEACIGVITNVQNPIMTSFHVLQHAVRAIQLDCHWQNGHYYGKTAPTEGLHLAAQMMYTGAFQSDWYETAFPRRRDEPLLSPASFETSMYHTVLRNIADCDANHWIYTCRATMMHDIARGYSSVEEALRRIRARVLLISCKQDMLQPSHYSERAVQQLQALGKTAAFYEFESEHGHMAGVLDTGLFQQQIRNWL